MPTAPNDEDPCITSPRVFDDFAHRFAVEHGDRPVFVLRQQPRHLIANGNFPRGIGRLVRFERNGHRFDAVEWHCKGLHDGDDVHVDASMRSNDLRQRKGRIGIGRGVGCHQYRARGQDCGLVTGEGPDARVNRGRHDRSPC